MRINGEWLLFDDGVMRPVIRGEILTGGGSWQPAEFLVDTGADRTVFSAATLLTPRCLWRTEIAGWLTTLNYGEYGRGKTS